MPPFIHFKNRFPMKLKHCLMLLPVLLLSSGVYALTLAPYSPDTLATLQAAGEPVALHFHASWCPTCRAQDQALEVLKADPALKITVLKVDYDKETTLRKQLKIRSQSTFIIYRGTVEKSRPIGETSPEGLRAALRLAL